MFKNSCDYSSVPAEVVTIAIP